MDMAWREIHHNFFMDNYRSCELYACQLFKDNYYLAGDFVACQLFKPAMQRHLSTPQCGTELERISKWRKSHRAALVAVPLIPFLCTCASSFFFFFFSPQENVDNDDGSRYCTVGAQAFAPRPAPFFAPVRFCPTLFSLLLAPPLGGSVVDVCSLTPRPLFCF